MKRFSRQRLAFKKFSLLARIKIQLDKYKTIEEQFDVAISYKHRDYRLIQYFLQEGGLSPETIIRPDSRYSATRLAISCLNMDALHLFIKRGMCLDYTDENKNNVLHWILDKIKNNISEGTSYALFRLEHHLIIFKMFLAMSLAADCNLEQANNEGKTPRQLMDELLTYHYTTENLREQNEDPLTEKIKNRLNKAIEDVRSGRYQYQNPFDNIEIEPLSPHQLILNLSQEEPNWIALYNSGNYDAFFPRQRYPLMNEPGMDELEMLNLNKKERNNVCSISEFDITPASITRLWGLFPRLTAREKFNNTHRGALNDMQKYTLNVTLSLIFEQIEDQIHPDENDNPPGMTAHEAVKVLQAMISPTVSEPEIKAFKKLDMWDNIEQVRQILAHPCPQNRGSSYPYIGQEAGFSMFKIDKLKIDIATTQGNIYLKNGRTIQKNAIIRNSEKDSYFIAKESTGLLSLTAQEDDSTSAVTKESVVEFIRERIKEKMAKYDSLALACCHSSNQNDQSYNKKLGSSSPIGPNSWFFQTIYVDNVYLTMIGNITLSSKKDSVFDYSLVLTKRGKPVHTLYVSFKSNNELIEESKKGVEYLIDKLKKMGTTSTKLALMLEEELIKERAGNNASLMIYCAR